MNWLETFPHAEEAGHDAIRLYPDSSQAANTHWVFVSFAPAATPVAEYRTPLGTVPLSAQDTLTIVKALEDRASPQGDVLALPNGVPLRNLTPDELRKTKTLNDWLDTVHVDEHPSGDRWDVIDETLTHPAGTFYDPADAYRYRLIYINRRMNP